MSFLPLHPAPHMPSEPSGISSNQRYQVLFELGRGGMGTAFLARSLGTEGFERLVVVKRLHPHLVELEDVVQRFLDEARVAAAVYHANVVGTQYAGKDGDGYMLVLDYVEGSSLEELVDRSALRSKRIPLPVLLRIALDTLAGLQAVHTASDPAGRPLHILHRDISLQNLLVGRDGVTRVADFGIARSAFRSVHTTQGTVMGKLIYLPREHLSREPVGPSLDLYSLGVTLWIALTGEEPWFVETEVQLLKHIVSDRIPLLSERMEVDPEVTALLAKATDPNPELRFQSALEMAAAVESVVKRPGNYAGYADVAHFVGELLDVDLARRRERIRTFLDAPSVENSSTLDVPFVIEPAVLSKNDISEALAHTPTNVSANASDDSSKAAVLDERAVPKHKRTWIFVAAAALACALGAFAAFRSMAGEQARQPRVVTPQPEAREAVEATPPPSVEVAPATAPLTTATETAAPRAQAPRPRRTVKTTKPRPTPAQGASTTAPRAPDDISKKNPYRQQ